MGLTGAWRAPRPASAPTAVSGRLMIDEGADIVSADLNRKAAWILAAVVLLAAAGCSKPAAVQAPPTYDVTLNDSPMFESAKGWGRAAPGGAVVGPGPSNANILTQKVAVHAGEPLKIVARASSVDQPKATGRLQINWSDAQGQPIGVAGKEIPVGSTPQAFELLVTAPAGAVAGYLYVSPHGEQDVVRYTEMRLLTLGCGPGRVANPASGCAAN